MNKLKRSDGIGASEVWKVFDDPMGLYLLKTGIIEDSEENEAMWLGTNFEPVMDKRYLKETGFEPYPVPPVIHPTEPWRRCTPDRGVNKPEKVLLEYKTTGFQNGWGEPGTAEVPFRVGCQVQWQLSLLPEFEYAEIPVYFFAPRREFRIYRMERNEEIISNLIEAGREFWENHVIPQIPPPIDASEGSKRLLNHLYPRDTEDMFAATANLEMLATQLKDTETFRDDVIESLVELQNKMKEAIGDHAGVVSSLGKITWKKSKDREVVDWKGAFDYVYDNLVSGASRAWELKKELINKYTKIIPGSRVFRTYWKKED